MAMSANTIDAASVSICPASEINASDWAMMPMTTSMAMNPPIRIKAMVSHFRSASAFTP